MTRAAEVRDMTATLLDLGDATSRNLEFSHRHDVAVSYGEETITETNLLELRRRHPELVRIRTFPKHREAKTGADWEWHIIGRKLTLKMRVQAKRVQCDDILKIKHVVKSSGRQQLDLLIEGARISRMKPIYCIYCTESQRTLWSDYTAPYWFESYHNGCLIAAAMDVPLTTRRLQEIETKCKPWHYLLEPYTFVRSGPQFLRMYFGHSTPLIPEGRMRFRVALNSDATDPPKRSGWNPPTIDDLNGDTREDFDQTGVGETNIEDLERLTPDSEAGRDRAQSDEELLRDLGICRMIVMDVRSELDS